MKRLRILYFSATGNTKRAAEIVRESCVAKGIDAEALELLDPAVPDLTSPPPGTETLIAFPTLGFGAPHLVMRRVRALPEGGGAPARVIATCGAEMKDGRVSKGWPGSGLEQVEGILRRKGYDVASTAFVFYPSNWTQVSDPPSGEARASLLATGDEATRKLAAAAIAGERGLYRCGPGNRLWSAIVNFLFRAVGRRVLGKFYSADPSCTGCGICAKACPSGSIAMRRGRPAWRLSCEDCNRCINVCPAEAIQVSVAKMVLYVLLSIAGYVLAIDSGGRVLASLLPGIGGLARAAASLVLALAATAPIVALLAGPVDALLRLASRAPFMGRLLSRGYTTRFGRYRVNP